MLWFSFSWISIELNIYCIYCCWVYFQTVASIEERTRPNLSKSLKGNWKTVIIAHVIELLSMCLKIILLYRAWTSGWPRASSGWCYHSPDSALQAKLRLIRQTLHSHGQLKVVISVVKLCTLKNALCKCHVAVCLWGITCTCLA